MKQFILCAVCGAFLMLMAACGGQTNNAPAKGNDSAAALTNDSMVNNSAGEPRILDTAKRGDSLPRQ